MAPARSGPNGAKQAPFRTLFPAPQRTLDLRREDVYLRIRLELHGDSAPPLTRRLFETTITHGLVKAHGIVGGAVPVEHVVGFINDDENDEEKDDDDDDNTGRGENEMDTDTGGNGTENAFTSTVTNTATRHKNKRSGHGIVKVHSGDFDTVATSLALLGESADGAPCTARVVGKAQDLVSLGFEPRRELLRFAREIRG